MEKLARTLATTVPAFFIREKPISRNRKPACMNITKTAATITQTVSTATETSVREVLKKLPFSSLARCRGQCRAAPPGRRSPGVQDWGAAFRRVAKRRAGPPEAWGEERHRRARRSAWRG